MQLQLWAMLKQTGNWGAKRQTLSGIDINQINDYFADIATDTKYSRDEVIKAVLQVSRSVNHHDVNYTREEVEVMLAKISRTSPGNDNIPYWVYRDCSNELADIVSRLVNMSVGVELYQLHGVQL